MTTLDERRRFYAEELEAVARLRSAALVDAFAVVPREKFLPPGPWTIVADAADSYVIGAAMRMRTTTDADPARVYHNIAVAIDPARYLFNGQPGTLGAWLDMLEIRRGANVLHIGAGLGYYTAILAECAGPSARIVAYEADAALAAAARRNLRSRSWVEVTHGDAASGIDGRFDAILVNAGVTRPLDAWLDALAPGGRMLLPITTPIPGMGATLGKGVVAMITNGGDRLSARIVSVVAIYSAIGIRDESLNEAVGKALIAGPLKWQSVAGLRRDSHEPDSSCWLHCGTCCFSAAAR